jgi:hypothetical protein
VGESTIESFKNGQNALGLILPKDDQTRQLEFAGKPQITDSEYGRQGEIKSNEKSEQQAESGFRREALDCYREASK